MVNRKAGAEIKKLTDLVKQVSEQKQREAAALEAGRVARKAIQQRGEFIPKRIKSADVQIRL